ncbi:YhjD/YihY/BrkB family envelope integrity protein [Pseudonocardia sp. N23]|uniref:YhjD/YihY/BrkB family envelope integrity protein n=1 Tax=Pseudonocardia sp. N23 TaxID=1987376 RepID=UPI000BFD80E8|nr:YhjD/YihY/BrkB family envelope integrity protein [Pseudonocardia sp. N23]GAY08069.1 inner membrane protein YihY [Pseudonocardia sp. N23]
MTFGARRDRMLSRYGGSLVVRASRRMIGIGGYDRALALSAQAFVALVPMLVVVAAALPDDAQGAAEQTLFAGLGLSEKAAAAVAELLDRPPDAGGTTVVGVVLLVLSVLGFTRTLQRTYAAAWGLPSRGVWGLGYGLLAAVALIVEFVALTVLGPLLAIVLGSWATGVVAQATGATLLWWPVQYLLLGGRVGWRPLLPGAALTGVGQAVVVVVSGLYLPLVVGREAERYGLVGVAVALLSWLVVLGLLLVVSAVLSAELSSTRPASVPDPGPDDGGSAG